MKFDYFIHDANRAFMEHQGNQRYGQFLMNYLHQKHPEIKISDEIDPFYDNLKVPSFLRYIHSVLN
jgi:hypothetical protein